MPRAPHPRAPFRRSPRPQAVAAAAPLLEPAGWLAVALGALLLFLLVPARGEAQQRGNYQIRSHSTRPAPQPQQNFSARRANPRLFGALGSAANARPGFYSDLLSSPVIQAPKAYHSPRFRGGGFQAPFVVYVDPSPTEPRIAGDRVSAPAPAPPTYQPPPIYIVQPQAPAPAPQPAPAPARPPEPRKPRPTAPQGVTMTIYPADAELFLDDDPLGVASGLGVLSLKPGVYVLEVSHPDYSGQRLVFGVETETLEIVIDLTTDNPNRRSRIR
ncbi:MAG: hypothetical protein AAF725_21435 [Acidobacteriota bacterium]